MKKHYLFNFLLLIGYCASGQKVTTFPSFHVDFSNPTADKPQSKLWYMDSCWWALLPKASGPSLWQRTPHGWKEHSEINDNLKEVPGRADVWCDRRVVTAVGVSDSSLIVFRLTPGRDVDAHWQSKVLGTLPIPLKNPDIETATIVQDTSGIWWVAADVGEAIYTWHSADAIHWSEALLMGDNISHDDISCITALRHSVVVIWSDQKGDAVKFREHKNGQRADHWTRIQTVASGGKTADDHLHTAVSSNGTLWLATKNSLDETDHPQLVLRVRTPIHAWRNYPYLLRENTIEPSRPVVIATSNPALVLAGHTIYNKVHKEEGSIVFGIVDTTSSEILGRQTTVIAPDLSLKVRVNNVTVPKLAYPSNAPWLILASDEKGNVYEADLRFFDR